MATTTTTTNLVSTMPVYTTEGGTDNTAYVADEILAEMFPDQFPMVKKTVTLIEEETYNLKVCPFHNCNLTAFEAESNQETYIKCPMTPCGIFSHTEQAKYYMGNIYKKLHKIYRKKSGVVKCQCNNQATLRISKSENNPGRPYYACRDGGGCRFFQWGDVPFTKKNEELQNKFNQAV